MNHGINPKWTKLANVCSIEEALTRYCKADLLGPLQAGARLVRANLNLDRGLTVLASRHGSNTGRALWILELDGWAGFEIYQSDK